MEVIFSSEKSVDFQRTTRRYIPEDIRCLLFLWDFNENLIMLADFCKTPQLKLPSSVVYCFI
jgi:hypothetical protein